MSAVVLASSLGDAFAGAAGSGPLVLAAPVAFVAGLVSFASPCVLPLVPGYLSYVTGMSGADSADAGHAGHAGHAGSAVGGGVATRRVARRRVLLGSSLFVLGFTAVFVSYGALFGGIGSVLRLHSTGVSQVLGAVSILLGLVFLGLVPGAGREFRLHRLPAAGFAGAPLLGVLFGVGWTPCIGPTLGVVLGLSASTASAGRGALLSLAYCAGLGLPFVGVGLGLGRLAGTLGGLRRHSRLVTALGGGLLVLIGVLEVSGVWSDLVARTQGLVGGFTTAV